jgi:tRNA(Ile)-lysidine synthase
VREKVLRNIREQGLMRAGHRVAVAVSGGADSVALLRMMLELRDDLGIVLAAAHFNHGLRGPESDADQAFVAELARRLGLEFYAGIGDVRDDAILNKLSVEAAGRELRYQWFARLAGAKRLDVVATAHTLDDQAETVLLKFLRGAGTRGLAGIYPMIEPARSVQTTPVRSQDGSLRGVVRTREASAAEVDQPRRGETDFSPGREPWVRQNSETKSRRDGTLDASVEAARARIVRPLLSVSRDEVTAYLTALGQDWREDESNLDHRFLRNRVRHELLPLLEHEYNPNIRRSLSDLADVSRGDEAYWHEHVEEQLTARRTAGQLRLEEFSRLPLALQRRLLKRFAEDEGLNLDFEHIETLRRCALGELMRTELPGGRIAVNAKECLELRSCSQTAGASYEAVLSIPGEVEIAGLGVTLRATIVPEQFARELPAAELLGRDWLSSELTVRNWRPGDRFWPAHSRSEEKLKRLFAERQIPAEQRSTWPVALHENEIVWVRAFPVARGYQWKGEGDAVKIEVMNESSS